MRGAAVYHRETPVAESWRPSNPPSPPAGRRDRGEPPADGASSISRLSPPSEEEAVAGAKGGTGPGPHHRCQEKRPRLWRDPAGRAPGRNRCNLSPSALEPALSSCPRSFSFAHSRGVASSPSRRRPATNPDGNKKNPDQTRRSRCFVSFPQWEQRYVFFYKSTKFKVH